MAAKRLEETVKRLRALLSEADLTDDERADAEEVLAAADLLCRLERMNDIHERRNDIAAVPPLRLEDALEAARREQAREGGSDGR